MPGIRNLIVLLFSVLAAGSIHADSPSLAEFDAAYKVRASIASGELAMSLRDAGDGRYVFRSLTRPRGLVRVFARGEIDESSTVFLENDSVVPLDYSLRDTISKDHDSELDFDWQAGLVSGVDQGEAVSAEIETGTLNRAALYVAIMRDLQSNRLPDQYMLFDDGRLKTYQLENKGSETIEVPLGSFEAVQLVRKSEGSRRSMHLWCAPALDYLPIRIDLYKDDKRVSRAELKAVRGLPAGNTS